MVSEVPISGRENDPYVVYSDDTGDTYYGTQGKDDDEAKPLFLGKLDSPDFSNGKEENVKVTQAIKHPKDHKRQLSIDELPMDRLIPIRT